MKLVIEEGITKIMKNKFDYRLLSVTNNYNDIIKNGLIILDTNALLNTYRFNKSNRERYFDVLNSVKDRLYLTNHSVQEFFKNRLEILYRKSQLKEILNSSINKVFNDLINNITTCNWNSDTNILNLLKNEKLLQTELKESLESELAELIKIINGYQFDNMENYLNEDKIIIDILEIFDGKVNDELTPEALQKIYKDGEERYKNSIPPGYKDKDKKSNDKFGDLIIWEELKQISIEKNLDILFVSDDVKEDWCESFHGNKLGPRWELIKEFKDETKHFFYSITSKVFINRITSLHNLGDNSQLEYDVEKIQKDIENNEKLLYNKQFSSTFQKNKILNDAYDKINLNHLPINKISIKGLINPNQYLFSEDAINGFINPNQYLISRDSINGINISPLPFSISDYTDDVITNDSAQTQASDKSDKNNS